MRVTPQKGGAILERDFAEAFKLINGNSWLSGMEADYASDSFVFSLTAGVAVVAGRLITTTATTDLSVTLKANQVKYVYLYLKTAHYGLNATGARLVAYDEEQQFIDAILLYEVKSNNAGISLVTDRRVKSLSYRYAHAGSGLASPYDSVSLAANTERTVTGTTETEVKRFSVGHEGTVQVTFDMKRSAGTGTCKIYTTSGGATAVATLTATTNTYASKTAPIPVIPGDEVIIKLVSSSPSYTTYIRNVALSYRLGMPHAPAVLTD